MTTIDLRESRNTDAAIQKVLAAPSLDAAFQALRDLFAGQLDFSPAQGSIPLHGDGLPTSATRIAEREGVRVVAVALPDSGRVLMEKTRAALKEVRAALAGDLLLVVTDHTRSEWHFVYPAMTAGREVLRRMVVQQGQPFRTVAERLGSIYVEAAHSDLRRALEAAYDVEAVTKKFFREYSRIFELVRGMVQGDLSDDERRLYCQTLMNRLMFLYFLQKKGWLRFDGNTNYLHALWRDHQRKNDGNFYESRLRLLFFTALSNPRDADYDTVRAVLEPLIGLTPFLNGGLFEQTDLDKQRVRVPDTAINLILNDLFAKFNFTIAESTPYDVEVAVDPEMLGKVFEELVTGRHQTGSYYTPRPIVSFMCREALKHYLQTKVPGLSAEVASAFIDDDQVHGLTMQQAGDVLRALETVTVLDPACGSGAYLLGMLHELIEQQRLLYNSDLIADDRSLYELKLRVIERNVYGVDIDPFAVNIAMLRLWLSLMIDWEGTGDPPALPNLAFKIVCGDSLLAPNPQEAGDIFRLSAHEQARELAKLKAAFMRDTGESKREVERRVREAEASITAMLSHLASPPGSVDWRVQFAEVFDSGGFDVVLANPPYVRMELFKSIKPTLRVVYPEAHTDRADLYIYFYARALQLLSTGGMLVFISSNKWLRANYGGKLRAEIARTARVLSITDFGELPVFESAATFPMIFVAQKGAGGGSTAFTQVSSLAEPYPDVRALIDRYSHHLPANALGGSQWDFSDDVSAARLRRMTAGSLPLGQYVGGQIYRGIASGLSAAFVIDGRQREEILTADPAVAGVIKHLLVGDNIRRWRIDRQDKWLLYTYHGIDPSQITTILTHLEPFRTKLEQRATQQEWYELQQPQMRYERAFRQPKIVFPDIAKHPRFTFDDAGSYLSNTAYMIPFDDRFLIGLLNSAVIGEYVKLTFACLGDPNRGGRFRFIYQYVEQIPIPNASPTDRNAIADLVQKCLDARGQGPEVAAWEAEIDERVARLYGLSGDGQVLTPAPTDATPGAELLLP